MKDCHNTEVEVKAQRASIQLIEVILQLQVENKFQKNYQFDLISSSGHLAA